MDEFKRKHFFLCVAYLIFYDRVETAREKKKKERETNKNRVIKDTEIFYLIFWLPSLYGRRYIYFIHAIYI